MTGVYVAMLAASLATNVTSACDHFFQANGEGSADARGFISREWTWSDGTSTTTFTAFGPPEQVNSLDPQNGVTKCPDCELASSVQFGPGDMTAAD